ncbi:MAG: hypothetical protein CL797_07810 [Chromatiales bacterium]|nr:hypothetical protein [Chromatiales bacterium]
MLVKKIIVLGFCVLAVACGSPEDRAADHVERAEALFAAGDFDKAELEARNAAQIEPKNPRARLLLAKIALQNGVFRTAVGHLLIAKESDPDLLEPHLLLGSLYFGGRAIKELGEEVESVNRIAPNDPGVILLNARLLSAYGDKEGALVKLEESIQADSANPEAVLFKAVVVADLEGPEAGIAAIDAHIGAVETDETEALRQFRLRLLGNAGLTDQFESELKVLAADFPDNKRYANMLARYYVGEGRLDDAEQALRSIADMDREDLNRQVGLIQFLAIQRGPKAAEEALREFIAESPNAPELRLSLAQLLESEERSDEAVAEYSQLIELAPKDDASFKARNRIVTILVRQDRPEEARELIEKILTERPGNVDALLARAAFNFASGQYDAVIVDARLAVRKDPESEEGLLMLSRAYGARGETVLADDAYRQVLALNPTNKQAATALATLLVSDGKIEEAQQILDRATRPDEEDVNLLESRVRILMAEGDLDEAESVARRIVELEPDSGRGGYNLGRVAAASGNTNAAIDAYQRSLEKTPSSLMSLQAIVVLELANGREEQAIDRLQQFTGSYPEQAGARLLLGNAYLQTGDNVAAERELKQLIEDQPAIPEAYLNLAVLQGENSDARYAVIRDGLEANPADQTLGILLGYEYERHGRIDEALAAYEEALSLNPGNDLVANNLAMLLLNKRTDEASLTRAMELARRFIDSRQAAHLDTLGWAYYRSGNYAAAVLSLENAVAAALTSPELRYHLGMAYRASGNLIGAKQELTKAVEMDPESFPGIDEVLAELQAQ